MSMLLNSKGGNKRVSQTLSTFRKTPIEPGAISQYTTPNEVAKIASSKVVDAIKRQMNKPK